MLARCLLSSKSNESRQCPKEVNLADDAGKKTLCVALEEVALNPALKYHLSSCQIMPIGSHTVENAVDRIIGVVSQMLLATEEHIKTATFDDEAEMIFNELFALKKASVESDDEKFYSFLDRKESDYYIGQLEGNNPYSQAEKDHNAKYDEEQFDKYGNYTTDKILELSGVHFSLVEEKYTILVVYKQIINYNAQALEKTFTAERLEFICEPVADEKLKYTFFIDLPSREENLIILSFMPEGKVFVNAGVYDAIKGTMKISKDPSLVHFEISDVENESERFYQSINNSPYIIIDSETGNEVEREEHIDDNGEKQIVIKMIPHKSYFCMCVQIEGKCSVPMEPEEIGDFYLDGVNGFKQSTYNALVWYNKAKTSESYRKMADVFACDPVFADVDMERKYRQLYELAQKADEE